MRIKDNIAPVEILDACRHWLNYANWSYGWPSNKEVPFGHWNVDISTSGIENTVDVSDKLPAQFKALWDLVKKEMFNDDAILVRCYSNRHTYGTEGYIHQDTQRQEDKTCVVYMDKEWSPTWGGETVIYKDDLSEIVSAVIPKYGRAIMFDGVVQHCAKPLSRICPVVRTTVMFKVVTDSPTVAQTDIDLKDFLLSVGANHRPHKNGSLMDHLLRTYYLLKNAKVSEEVALVGGLHSVYGTNAMKNACLSLEDTSVEEKFGFGVARLAKLFATIDRPRCLENPDGSLSDLDLIILRSVECANLYDQQELNPVDYPNLCEFVDKVKRG